MAHYDWFIGGHFRRMYSFSQYICPRKTAITSDVMWFSKRFLFSNFSPARSLLVLAKWHVLHHPEWVVQFFAQNEMKMYLYFSVFLLSFIRCAFLSCICCSSCVHRPNTNRQSVSPFSGNVPSNGGLTGERVLDCCLIAGPFVCLCPATRTCLPEKGHRSNTFSLCFDQPMDDDWKDRIVAAVRLARKSGKRVRRVRPTFFPI